MQPVCQLKVPACHPSHVSLLHRLLAMPGVLKWAVSCVQGMALREARLGRRLANSPGWLARQLRRTLLAEPLPLELRSVPNPTCTTQRHVPSTCAHAQILLNILLLAGFILQ